MPLLFYNAEQPDYRSLAFDDVVLDAARTTTLDSHLFILPTQRLARRVERDIVRAFFDRTSQPIERLPIFSFGSFVNTFYDVIEGRYRTASQEVQLALIYRAVESVDLEFFGRKGRTPSPAIVEKLANVIRGVRSDGVMPTDFALDLEHAASHPDDPGYDQSKLRDLYNIYSEYLRLLSGKWIDHPGKMITLQQTLEEQPSHAFPHAFPGVQQVLFHGFPEFTPLELRLVSELGKVPSLQVLVYLDYEQENGPLYGNFDEMNRKLQLAGFQSIELDPLEPNIAESSRRPLRHHLRKNLFRTDERIENPSFDNAINVIGFFNREEEVQGIASLIKHLVADENVHADRICIAAPDLSLYGEMFHEQLAGYGIPANVASPFSLDHSTLLTSLIAALSIPAGNYDRRDVVRTITSPYLSFNDQIDSAAMIDASDRLRIQRGRGTWIRRITQRLEFLQIRIPSLIDDDDRQSFEREVESLKRALSSIRALDTIVQRFDRRMSPREFKLAFQRLTGQLRAAENILSLRGDLEQRPRTPQDWQRIHDQVERDTRALAAFYRLLDELAEFLEAHPTEDAKQFELETGYRYALEFYLERLRISALRSHFRLREKQEYGVLVAPIDQIHGLDFDVVVICGLVDGEFPSAYLPESFLGKPLPESEQRQLRRERVNFHSAASKFNRRLFMTYPRFRGETAVVRSSFIDAFLRITTLERSGRVIEADEQRVERDRIRRGEKTSPHIGFIRWISTLADLAEEAGTVLWDNQNVPSIDAANDILANLRHTTLVERLRTIARISADDTLAREYRGVIAEGLLPEELAQLQERRRKEYSASQLELYARCPFKFFTRRVLGIVPKASYDVSLTPLERGVLVHKVLFLLYTELRENGELPITAESRSRALDRAREIAQNEIDGIVFDHPYWRIDQERLVGSGLIDGLLERWITADINRLHQEKSELIPEFFEVSFGGGIQRSGSVDGRLSSGEEVRINNLLVRGQVDRVEVFRRGDELFFAIADYKTGMPPGRKEIKDGSSLQLMIYLEVIRRKLAEHYQMPVELVRPVGGIYYRLDTRNVDTKSTHLFVPNELKKDIIDLRRSKYDPESVGDLQQVVDDVFEHAAGYVEGIAGGVFHVTQRDVQTVCRGCEYHGVCRVESTAVPL